ncbi:putative uncharacterized protein [Janthinobacterium agaricidamnosum NBRC 102515 = DSM 9628]|uniref:DUF2946 domain-containing protein n=2 Tax=Janthinobacterium agaricidamnosum TaxID=55508 RepID=W0V2U3_9BURK|nr:DUF2946 domain-containing protein [Janthinobacterium agaricidamnosum]CDG83149.1 putative uncharacterized protein [Janthinobacterium agaricidamnosum NBRC 102515 = DSM 9628]
MLHAWIACLAILFSALAPSISHALAAAASGGRGPVLAEICSADGVQYASLSDSGHPGPDTAMDMQHCPYCATHAGSFALLPPSLARFSAIGGHDVYPVLFYDPPQPLFSWTAARPRGPPAPP